MTKSISSMVEPTEVATSPKRRSDWSAESGVTVVDPTTLRNPEGTGSTGAGAIRPRRLSDSPDFLSVGETAILLGISRNLVWRAIADGQIACVRIGRRVLVPRMSIVRLVDRDADV